MNEVSNFISAVGFPIAIACCLMYCFYKLAQYLYKVAMVVVDKIIATFDKITNANEELVKTNSILASKIENKIDIVIEKLDQKEVV